jgi:pimeloyl-ACP methyl ester carboxylesterase
MRIRTVFAAVATLALGLALVLLALNPIDQSISSKAYYDTMENPPARAAAFSAGGSYFSWSSALSDNSDFGPLNIFYRSFGTRQNPAIVMVHGFPTSSYDFAELINELKHDYYIVVVDTPGYGFSDKPAAGYKYSLFEDARLLDTLIQKVVKLDRFTLLTHDKGDSVGFALLQLHQSGSANAYRIDHHVILNGGIYLPLAELSYGQHLISVPVIGPVVTRLMSPARFTDRFSGMYVPELTSEQKKNLASVFAYQGGISVLPATIKYLDERRQHEVTWLQTLNESTIPATVIWGDKDPVAVPAIADYVWKNYLRDRPAAAAYWRIPCAGHYPQNDQPVLVAQLTRRAMGEADEFATSESDCAPIRVR